MIEASFLQQYGIRLRTNEDLPWDEFAVYLAGLLPDTPLGRVVQIRAEKDIKIIESFGPAERKIYDDWKARTASTMSEKEAEQMMADIERALISAFG